MTQLHKSDRDLIWEINRNLVLNRIKGRGPVARSEITRLSGLSAATVSGTTGELLASDLVHEMGAGEFGHIPLVINPQLVVVGGEGVRSGRVADRPHARGHPRKRLSRTGRSTRNRRRAARR